LRLDFTPFAVSFSLALWTTAILAIVSFPLAWIFATHRGRWVPFVESLFSLPLVLPPTVLGFYLLVLFSPYSPVGGFIKRTTGLTLVFSFPGLVVASCIAGFPFMMSALRNGILAVPHTLLEASWTLGKSRFETILRVVLPNMKPAILAGAVTTFARTLGEFGVVLMIGGSLPGVTKTVSIAIYERTESQDFAAAHLYAIVLLALSYVGVFALNRIQRAEGRRER
jgi:molybdate transport system permease protein